MFDAHRHSQAPGVSWHHLPALYMLDFQVMVLAVLVTSAFVTTLVLLPVMRKAMPTVFVVFTCVFSGFLAAYSVLLPDWLSSAADLAPAPLSYHEWMASPSLSPLRLHSRRIGLHIGLSGANITLLALPIQGPAGCASPGKLRPLKDPKGCFAELNPRGCPRKQVDLLFAGPISVRHSRAEGLSRMFRGDDNWNSSDESHPAAASRKLLWHEWSEDVEEAYREARRAKPVYFAKAPGNVSSSTTPAPRRGAAGPSELGGLGQCVAGVGPGMPVVGPAWFDERVDWAWGSGPGTNYRSLLERGVSGPVLVAGEYLSRHWDYGSGGGEGAGLYGGSYDWGGRFRKAGHWTSCVLYAALVLWSFSIPLQMSEPESGARLLGVSGLLMLSAAPLYASLVRSTGDKMRVEGVPLHLRWGACFYCSVLGGSWAALAGFSLALVRRFFPGAMSTDLDLEEVRQKTAKVRPISVPEAEGPRSMLQFT